MRARRAAVITPAASAAAAAVPAAVPAAAALTVKGADGAGRSGMEEGKVMGSAERAAERAGKSVAASATAGAAVTSPEAGGAAAARVGAPTDSAAAGTQGAAGGAPPEPESGGEPTQSPEASGAGAASGARVVPSVRPVASTGAAAEVSHGFKGALRARVAALGAVVRSPLGGSAVKVVAAELVGPSGVSADATVSNVPSGSWGRFESKAAAKADGDSGAAQVSAKGHSLGSRRTHVVNVGDRSHLALLRKWHVPFQPAELENPADSAANASGSSSNPRPLAWLDLHMCRLRSLDSAYVPVEEFEYVHADLSLNYLSAVPAKALGAKLRSLDLSLNQITSVDGDRLQIPGLRVLKLHRNQVIELSSSSLLGVSGLVELDLSCNLLERTEHLGCLSQLKSLVLRGNRIEVATGLGSLVSLERLDLSHNLLVDALALAQVPSLTHVDLSSNQLTALDEVCQVLFCLTKVSDLKLLGNALCAERSYRMRVLENGGALQRLDGVRVSPAARAEILNVAVKSGLDDMVEEITRHYMKWIEEEHRQMQEQVEILHRREKLIESAFLAYRKQMEQELDECIAYIQELASEEAQAAVAAGAPSQISMGKSNNSVDSEGTLVGAELKRSRRAKHTTSERALRQWRRFLEQAEQTRLEVYKEQVARSTAAMEETVSLRSDAESYPSKLVALSKQRPSIWRELKRLEADAAVEEERVEAQGLSQAQEERDRVRDALALRAENRTRDTLGVAEKLHVSLR
jgi:hypothetical protein